MADRPKTASDKQKERSDKLEAQIRDAEKRKQERQFLDELAKRISIAREGRTHIERKNYPAAMASYKRFLSITSRSFQVEIQELSPSLFDEKNRVSESLIISSIFFDLLKMLDKIENESAKEERRLYHKLFLRFTKGMPYQTFAAENVRKHLIYSSTLRNKNEFWATYKAMAGDSFCIVATWAFEAESHGAVAQIRRFRDQFLLRRAWGQRFTSWYYDNGQFFVIILAKIPGAKLAIRTLIRFFVYAQKTFME